MGYGQAKAYAPTYWPSWLTSCIGQRLYTYLLAELAHKLRASQDLRTCLLAELACRLHADQCLRTCLLIELSHKPRPVHLDAGRADS